MAGRLEGKTAIITGGGSGMGAAACKLFASEGCQVVVSEINEQNGEAVKQEIMDAGGQAIFARTDISDEASVESCTQAALKKYGKIDILYNNGGIGTNMHSDDFIIGAPLWEIPLKDWNRMMSINLNGVYLFCKSVIPHMMERHTGAILNTSSENAIKAVTNADSYTAAKGAIVSMSMVLAGRLGKHGIRVNCICPGGCRTPISGPKWDQPVSERFQRGFLDKLPISRYADPIEIAYPALFLVSDEASYVTGTTLPIDGGWSII